MPARTGPGPATHVRVQPEDCFGHLEADLSPRPPPGAGSQLKGRRGRPPRDALAGARLAGIPSAWAVGVARPARDSADGPLAGGPRAEPAGRAGPKQGHRLRAGAARSRQQVPVALAQILHQRVVRQHLGPRPAARPQVQPAPLAGRLELGRQAPLAARPLCGLLPGAGGPPACPGHLGRPAQLAAVLLRLLARRLGRAAQCRGQVGRAAAGPAPLDELAPAERAQELALELQAHLIPVSRLKLAAEKIVVAIEYCSHLSSSLGRHSRRLALSRQA